MPTTPQSRESHRQARRAGSRPTVLLALVCLALPALAIGLVMHSTAAIETPAANSASIPDRGGAHSVTLSGSAGKLRISVQVAPGTFGLNRFLVDVRDATGRPLQGASLRLLPTMLDMVMVASTLDAAAVAGGRYQAVGTLGMPGNWRLSVTVHGAGLPAGGIQAAFPLQVGTGPWVMPTPLRALPGVPAQARPRPTPTPIDAAAVRWPALPYRAAVSFVTNGLVYLPGRPTLLQTGQLNHSIARVPGRDEAWITDFAGGDVAVLDLRTQRIVSTIAVGIGPVHVAFSAGGRRAWVTNLESNEVSVIDVAGRHVLATVQVGLHPHGLAISPDGREVWVACGGAGGIWVLDTRTNAVIAEVPAGLQPHAVVFSPDGITVYMTDAGASELVVIDRRTQTVRARIAIGTGSAMAAVSADGSRIWVSGQGGNVISVVDARTRRVTTRIPVGQAPHGLVLTPDGRLLYVGVNGANQLAVIDTQRVRVVVRIPMPGPADELILWQ